ncbi:MAG: hypothetical protein IPL59_08425 [Candidatus Competibacteraceae bacterium]|nr:hypothetical protein [Candidatus Competibacteraceae bacterium]
MSRTTSACNASSASRFEIDPDSGARLVGALDPGRHDGPWRLTLDRTHWKFGVVDINLVLVSPIA